MKLIVPMEIEQPAGFQFVRHGIPVPGDWILCKSGIMVKVDPSLRVDFHLAVYRQVDLTKIYTYRP